MVVAFRRTIFDRRWYEVAARRGDTQAFVNLGWMNTFGEGGRWDYKVALRCYRIAVQRGDDIAKNNLGVLYLGGLGVTRDLVRSHMWFNLAAAPRLSQGNSK